MKTAKQIHEIDPWKVKVFVHRERDAERFERVCAAIEARGQLHPGQVQDIRDRSKEERTDEDGRLCDYKLVTGEGRLLCARKLKRKFRAFIEDEKDVGGAKFFGFFTVENTNREALPWAYKARLVRPELEAGVTVEEIAQRLHLTPNHVLKFKRILDKVAPEVEDDVANMPMNDAEVLTAAPRDEQKIVVAMMKEVGTKEVRALLRRVEAVKQETGEVSLNAMRADMKRLDEDLRRMRDSRKVVTFHDSLGPTNYEVLLKDRKFRKKLDEKGINYAKFEALLK